MLVIIIGMNNKRINDYSFFSVDAIILSKKLLGKIIARRIGDEIFRFRIVEVEAYLGLNDEACHSHKKNRQRGKATPMYRQGGFTYIYLIYGIYYCFNIVAAPENDPQSVLIRALEPIEYENFDFKLKKEEIHTNGPGKLCRFLQLGTKFNNINLITNDEIWLEENMDIDNSQIVESKRINIGSVGEYVDKPWRFYIKNNQFVSKIDKENKAF